VTDVSEKDRTRARRNSRGILFARASLALTMMMSVFSGGKDGHDIVCAAAACE